MSLTFVNHNGDPISASRMAAMRAQGMELKRQRRLAAKADPVSVHKGWRVSGIKPECWKKQSRRTTDFAKWRRRQAASRRSRLMKPRGCAPPSALLCEAQPYILQEAAQQCKELAAKAGWLEVQPQEIKKTVA